MKSKSTMLTFLLVSIAVSFSFNSINSDQSFFDVAIAKIKASSLKSFSTTLSSLSNNFDKKKKVPSFSKFNLQKTNTLIANCPENNAIIGTATASSEAFGGFAAAAIDGATTGDIHHSASETDPWWQVDLGSVMPVEEIIVYLRGGQAARFQDAVVEVLDASDTVVFTNTVTNVASIITIPVSGISGQKVRIRLVGNNRILEFYEVEVYTNTGDCPLIVNAVDNSCINGVVGNDGSLVINSTVNTEDRVNYSTGSTYTGDIDYNNAFVIGTLPHIVVNSLANPATSEDYTIRIFNGSSANFTDVTVTLTNVDCSTICDCNEFVYLNETTNNGAVHKFEVEPDGTLNEVAGSKGIPWYASANEANVDFLTNPHGLGRDLNGNFYIGNNFISPIRKLDCLGNIEPTTSFEVMDGGFNIGTVSNTIYINSYNNDGIQAYDACTEANQGYVLLELVDGTSAMTDDWGFYVDDKATFYATSGFSACGDNSLFVFNPTPADFTNNTTYNPVMISDGATPDPAIGTFGIFPEGDIRGVTTDEAGNIYIVRLRECVGGVGGGCSRVYKYAPDTYELLAKSNEDCAENGEGWNSAIGIVYSADCNCLYTSTQSAIDDCVHTFDTNLVSMGAGIGPVPSGGQAKGIAISKECCPTSPNIVIDTILCNSSTIGQIFFLQDFINCTGTMCEGDWLPAGTNTGMTFDACENSFSLTQVGACGSFSLSSDGTATNNRCGAFSITVNIIFNSIDLTVSQSSCVDNLDGTFTANYDAVIDWNSVPCQVGEMINVTSDGVSIGMIDPSTDSSPSTFSVAINADGDGTHNIKAAYTIANCSDSLSFKAPTPCPIDVNPCASTSGCIGGNVFEDFNCNGADDSNEPGVQGLAIQIYDCDNVLVGTSYSDAEGDWQVCSLTDGTAYRVEFVLPEAVACWATPTHVAGSGNQSEVQFLTAPACTQFSVSNPDSYCEDDNLRMSTVCFVNGTANGNEDVLVGFDYLGTGTVTNGNKKNLGSDSELGSVWGLAYDRRNKFVYTSSVLRRHVGLAATPGMIYQIDVTDEDNPSVVNFMSVSNAGVLNEARGLSAGGNNANPSHDVEAYAKVGRMSLGDIDISEDGKTLWTTNLNTRELVKIDATTATEVATYAMPQNLCDEVAETRPWAVKVYRNEVYVGVVCSGENDGTFNGNVLKLEADGSFSVVSTVDLSYAKAEVWNYTGNGCDYNEPNTWKAWNDTWPSTNCSNPFGGGDNYLNSNEQPILSDIEFDTDGSLILGFLDRFAMQSGPRNYQPDVNDTDTYFGYSGGDILRICKIDGSFVQEGGAGCTQTNGEFYSADNYVSGGNIQHPETSLGGLATLPGSGELAVTVFDPLDNVGFPSGVNTGGIKWANNSNGTSNRGLAVYGNSINNPGTFGKLAGLGDLEIFCPAAPLEIGNYVWCDSLENGIQDACERGINNILVSLYDRNGVLVGQDTTSNSGQYYFNQNNVDSTGITVNGSGIATPVSGDFTGMSYETQYFIVFGGGQFASSEFTVDGDIYGISSMVNAGSNDNIDSDVDGSSLTTGSLGARPDGLPFIDMTTSATGCGDHKYDLGVTCDCTVPIIAALTNENICEGDNFTASNVTTSVTNGVPVSFQWYNDNGTDNPITGAISGQTTAVLTALPTTSGSYTYRVEATNTSDNTCFASQSVTLVIHPNPSVSVNNPTICEGNTATITASATDGDGSYTYAWDVPMGESAPGNVSSFTANTAGNYSVTVTDGNSCTVNDSGILTINPLPTATAVTTDPSCSMTTSASNDDGTITLSGFNPTDTYQYNTGNSFNSGSATPATPMTIPNDGIIVNNSVNPTGSQDYTVRITSTTGCFVDRVVILNEVTCSATIDYADYSSGLRECANEPCHIVDSNLYLGQSVSPDANPVTGESADSDDDDGVSINSKMQIVPGNTVRFPVTIYNNTGSVAYLRMWIDWNADGDFEDAGEQIEDNTYPSTGMANVVLVSVTVPLDAVQTSPIALRARLSTDDTNSATPCGTGTCAADGEIEDYLIQLNCPVSICPPVQLNKKTGNQ